MQFECTSTLRAKTLPINPVVQQKNLTFTQPTRFLAALQACVV